MRRALVTGGSGYIGGRLVRRLLEDGVEVHALTRRPRAGLERRARWRPYDGTARSAAAAVAAARPDAIFHLAAVSKLEFGPEDVDAMEESILRLGVQLADAAVRRGPASFVAAGTFWQSRTARDAAPMCLYAALKQGLEDALAYYASATPLRTAVLRLFSVYGPDDPRGRLVSQLWAAHKDGGVVEASPGRQVVEPIFVDDAVAAFVHAARLLERRPGLSGRSWAVGSGERLTLRGVAREFRRSVGPVRVRWGARPYRPREVMVPWSGPRLPGWRPRVRLAEGLRRACA